MTNLMVTADDTLTASSTTSAFTTVPWVPPKLIPSTDWVAGARNQLRRYLTVLMMRRADIGITILDQNVQVHSQTSLTIAVTAVLTRGGVTGAVEGNLRAKEIILDVEVDDGEWKIVSSRQSSAL